MNSEILRLAIEVERKLGRAAIELSTDERRTDEFVEMLNATLDHQAAVVESILLYLLNEDDDTKAAA